MQSSNLRKCIRVLICLILSASCFFFLYAFRYDALRISNQFTEQRITISEKRINALQKKIKHMDIQSYDDQEKIQKYLNDDFPDYAVQLIGIDFEVFLLSEIWPNESQLFQVGYERDYTLNVGEQELTLVSWPKFNKMFASYAMLAMIVSLMIGIVFYILLSLNYRNGWIRRLANRICRWKVFQRLSIQLVAVNILAISLGLGFYTLANQNKYSFFEFLFNHAYNSMIDIDEQKINDTFQHVYINELEYKDITSLMKKVVPDNSGIDIFDEDYSHIASYNRFDEFEMYEQNVVVISTPIVRSFHVPSADQILTITIYYYPLLPFVYPFQILIVLTAILIYMIILLNFMQYKVMQIRKIQEDIGVLASGNLYHEVSSDGTDEVAQLAHNVNLMRLSFIETLENEEKLQQSNRDLITSISHDLRTPLTSLLGYLEIIKYQKDPNKNAEYLDKSLTKVEQIRTLSDEMFSYFLVYGKQKDVELLPTAIGEFIDYLNESCILLEHDGYTVYKQVQYDTSLIIDMNVLLLKRALDNVFSNIQKYADKSEPVLILVEVKKGYIHLVFENKVAKKHHVESNQIGVKSIERVIDIHKGCMEVKQSTSTYTIRLQLPIHQLLEVEDV
ncbi:MULTISPECIES: HAMP domain-containing sensor histidine kinase [unclassified Breznakia]|uniref:HAMP domain-containing sensor histidine kinase n=1 Tax=unclassified Breznakia TaxID=2623764 RepID=UPI0024763304|nr:MULTISPECIES: HAMP domain-containing sensor histidine kinase [unclassified Breznakia]MDH6366011.1 signal transduction histidine kinase [Breznakia sp. PH1-1]MDH6403057.1 signal transduction histidine kinase [Breznakia sp. PF1-11]MDH6410766.1 signal transduction histidine kinase [Breznakia sp. PFB1-11]MDH6413177.1 signal transduction histidine kinase [Breznakia sp. PFB1-14]MDH6415545.1 signal transduction histidine kinase [Breznakia sp. PFB1-4]